MLFDLEDRLLKLAKKLVFHESPAPEQVTGRRFDDSGSRKSLKPEERRADERASEAAISLRSDESGPKAVSRAKQLVVSPGGGAVDEQVWKRTEAAQKSTAAPLPPAVAARLSLALGHDVSDINVHTDAAADQICREAGSEVVARGRDVFFKRGTPPPGSPKGDQLLAQAIEQLSVDSRVADDDQPMRRFMENEEDSTQEEPVMEEPKKSGWGLMGLVGAAVAAKKAYDSTKDDKTEVKPEAPAPETAADLEKVATEGEKGPEGPKPEAADLKADVDPTADRSELVERERKTKEVLDATEAQLAEKEQLPDHPVVEEQREALGEMATAATALLGDVREAKSEALQNGTDNDEEREPEARQVAADLGVTTPFRVAADYEAEYQRLAEEQEAQDVEVDDHRLLMEVDVDDAGQEFASNAFGPDLGITVDRVMELVDEQLQDQVHGVTGEERERLLDDIDKVKPQLPEIIEQQVREAAESNKSEEQEELELQLQQEQLESAEGEQQNADDTFAFGARIDLQTGQVVVTTSDAIPASVDAAPAAAGPTTTSGGGGGDGGGGGSGGGGGGGGGGGAPAA